MGGRGAVYRECRGSPLGVRGWRLTINPHRVEISIDGCVEEMVRDPNLLPFVFLFLFLFLLLFLSEVHCF